MPIIDIVNGIIKMIVPVIMNDGGKKQKISAIPRIIVSIVVKIIFFAPFIDDKQIITHDGRV